MNDTISILEERGSLRKYKDQDISKEHLDQIIQSAMRAPTAGNMMLYSIIVVKDKDVKRKLAKTCDNQPFIEKASVILVFLADFQRWYDYFEHCNVKEFCEKNNRTFDTPDEGDYMLAVQDAMCAAQNAVISAESIGIGSCYIGDIIEHYEIHKEMFNLPDYVAPLSMLCLGYYEDDHIKRKVNRFDREYIVFDEKYKRLSNEDFDKMYSEKEKLVAPNNIFNAGNFGQMIYARKLGSEFSKEMARSAKLILDTWCGRK